MPDTAPEVDVPSEFVSLMYPLPHLAKALVGGAPVRIVAIGSSSTAGRADVVSYPHRLEMYLRGRFGDERFPNLRIDVLNRGRGGEEAIEELLRFNTDIFAEKPALVIWQVGTNAVFHNYDLGKVAASIAKGLKRLRGKQMDVVLIDPQYTPAMLFDDKADGVVDFSRCKESEGQSVPTLGADAALSRAQQYRFGLFFRPNRSGQASSERLEHAPRCESAQRGDREGTPGRGVVSFPRRSLKFARVL